MLQKFLKYVLQSVAGMIGISVYILADTYFISVYSGADGQAISKYFIDRMGGTVRVESEFGKGSRFSFTVVQKIADTQSQKAQMEKHHNGTDSEYWFTTKGARVLLVDDNEINREVVRAIVEPLELVIEEAGDGQARRRIRRKGATYQRRYG